MTVAQFKAKYLQDAKSTERTHKIPWQVTLAQAGVESGWGKHAPGNMFFGIKAGSSWKGARQLLSTSEVTSGRRPRLRSGERIIAHYPPGHSKNRFPGKHHWRIKAWFRKYSSAKGSFADHARLLRNNSRYAKAFRTSDPRQFAREIARAGYATAPNYARTLISVIDMLEGKKNTSSASTSSAGKSSASKSKGGNALIYLGIGLLAGAAAGKLK